MFFSDSGFRHTLQGKTPPSVRNLVARRDPRRKAAPGLVAQQHAPQERIAEGSVVSKSDVPLAGAIVYLKDTKTNAVKTYIADKDGHFRFGELSQNTDYELWAENDGLHSRHKGISYISSKNDYNFTLKIDSQK